LRYPAINVIMLLNLQHYHRPTSLAEAVALLKKNPHAVVPLAGGTHLVPSDAPEITEVVDITHLGLNFIEEENDVLRMGATTTLQEILESETARSLAQGILVEACQATTVSRMLQNVSTVGGELVVAAPQAGLPVALLALDATLRVVGDQQLDIALAEFYQQDAKSWLNGALITEVAIPKTNENYRAAFLRLAHIESSLPVVQVAALVEIEQGVCQKARIALGAVAPKPLRVRSAEELLEGQIMNITVIESAAEQVAAAIDPISDTHGSADYRREMSRVLVRRALRRCLEQL
jgi:carbon-monoxide dehydrogenase medium subunit